MGDSSNKHSLFNIHTSEDDDMTNIGNNNDSSTNKKNPNKVIRHHCESIQEAQNPNERVNANLSTSANLHGVPISYIPLGQMNRNCNPEFEILS